MTPLMAAAVGGLAMLALMLTVYIALDWWYAYRQSDTTWRWAQRMYLAAMFSGRDDKALDRVAQELKDSLPAVRQNEWAAWYQAAHAMYREEQMKGGRR